VRPGRFGPYVNHGKLNATLPKSVDPDAIGLEEALALLSAKQAAGGGARRGRVKTARAKSGKSAKSRSAKSKSAASKSTASKSASSKSASSKNEASRPKRPVAKGRAVSKSS
jgi:DNA topoisomerase I